MKYGIINAEQTEMDSLLLVMKEEIVVNIYGVCFHKGIIGLNEVVIVNCGIGKVAAASIATLLLSNFEVDCIINSGSAGALDDDLKIGDVVVANELAYFDVDVKAFGYEYGQVPQQPSRFIVDEKLMTKLVYSYKNINVKVKEGLIVSGDTFIHSIEQREFIKQHFITVQAVEMEGAAIAQIATRFGIPFAVVRAISDNSNGDACVSYDEFVIDAGNKSAQVLIDFLS